MPGAKESSTVEWHSAHWIPIDSSVPRLAEKPGDAHDRVQLQQRERSRWIAQIDAALLEFPHQRKRQRLHVDFEADAERSGRIDSRSDAAIFGAGNRLMELQRVAPERFVAERVEAKRVAPFVDHVECGLFHRVE